jgi:hypothetical protein
MLGIAKGIYLMLTAQRLAPSRSSHALAVLSVCFALSGCADGLELNGKIFDVLGVSAAAQAQAKAEPKMATRSGLVLPPDSSRLPPPGTGDEPASLAALNDPETVKAQAAVERARLHKAYCSGDLSWKQQLKEPSVLPTSPYGSCSNFSDLKPGRP